MEQNLTQKTKFGMLWNAFEKFASQGISFVLNIILARLLTPHDYGVIGMLTIFLTFSNVFIDSGFSRALVQKQDRNEKDFSTVLLFNVSVSLILYVVLFLCSPIIARFYKTPELVQLERVFFIVIILNSLSVVQNSQLQAAVDFKRIAFINTLTQICSGVAGIIIPSRRNVQVNATVEKTSAGAINHIPIIKVNSLVNAVQKLKNSDWWVVAADASAKDNYYDVNYKDMNCAIIMGAEHAGVSKSLLKLSDFIVKIPMFNDFNSLNVSNALSAIIFETVRQKLKN